MKKKMIKVYSALQSTVQRGISTLKSNKGVPEYIHTIAIIIIGLVFAAALIAGLMVLFKGSLLPSIQKAIEDLFNAV